MKLSDPRKTKIKDLKTKIANAQLQIQEYVSSVDVTKEMELPEEERKANQEKFRDELALRRADITAMKEELKQTRLNKYSSSFFEFTPNKGMNRRQAREFRKSRRRNGKHNSNQKRNV
jgi:phosphotransacetylase